jgi:hypothetical protein
MRRHHRARKAFGAALIAGSAAATGMVIAQHTGSSATSCHTRGLLPDPVCTPGALNPDVNQSNIQSTICVRGWTATIRPPVSVTGPEKQQSMKDYGISGPAEYDHLISLELGGAPNDPHNLWPEAGSLPNTKDTLENRLHDLVCSGRLPLAAAQLAISNDWTAAYVQYVGPLPANAH